MIVGRVVAGVRSAGADMASYALAHPDFAEAARRFGEVYAQGVASLVGG